MAVVDIFIVLIFSFSILMGFYRGVIWEFLKYIAFAIALALSAFTILKSHSLIAGSDYPLAVGATIGIIIFVAVLVITLGIAHWLSKQLRNTGFGNSDRILGLVFGLLRAAVFTLLLYSGMMLISKNQKPDWIKESMFVGLLDKGHKSIEKIVFSVNSPKLNRLLNIDLALDSLNSTINGAIKSSINSNSSINNGIDKSSSDKSSQEKTVSDIQIKDNKKTEEKKEMTSIHNKKSEILKK